MSRVNRISHFLLALVLATAFITLSGHSAAHANAGVKHCHVCASYADLSSTAMAQDHSVPVEINIYSVTDMVSVNPLPGGQVLTHRPRAPPAIY